jgi:hypothetical protein
MIMGINEKKTEIELDKSADQVDISNYASFK